MCFSHYFKVVHFLFCHTRYELAQQLQPQSTDDPLGGGTVAHDMQVEIEGDSLQQPPASSADQQSMLGLGQSEVVNGSQQVTLDTPLTDQPLGQGEGKQGQWCCKWLHIIDGLGAGPQGTDCRILDDSMTAWHGLNVCLVEGQSNVCGETQRNHKDMHGITNLAGICCKNDNILEIA